MPFLQAIASWLRGVQLSGTGGVTGWDAQTGKELLFFISGALSPGLAVSPDGKRIAGTGNNSSSSNPTVIVWDAETGKEMFTLKGHVAGDIAFSPDGQRLVSASLGESEMVKVWNAQNGEELLSLDGRGPVTFSPDGHRLYGRAADGTMKVWDATPLPEKR